MSASATATTPGCLLCLVQTSAGMLRTPGGAWARGRNKLTLARVSLDRILGQLLDRREQGDPRVLALDVGVLAFWADGVGTVHHASLLRGVEIVPPLVPLERLGGLAVSQRSSDRSWRFVDPERALELAGASSGPASVGPALAHTLPLLQRWLSRHPRAWPPVVLYLGDGEGCDDSLELACHSLRLLATPRGRAGLAHLLFTELSVARGAGHSNADTSGPWQRLWGLASDLEAGGDGRPRRAFTLNTPPWLVVEELIGSSTVEGAAEDSIHLSPREEESRPGFSLHELWYVKGGNEEAMWEDAYAFDPGAGVAAVSDGAGEGIFCRRWAALLVEGFVRDRPDLNDPEELLSWLDRCRTAWIEQINYPSLRWSQQNKVNDTGAAATLLTWQLEQGSVSGEISYRWQAWAVGDSCLLWVRDQQLLASFPVAGWRDFALGPNLLRTQRVGSPPAPVLATGTCRPGDLFLLATDAVAQALLRAVAEDQPPDWGWLATAEPACWRGWIDSQREAQRIVNDDCTLLALSVGPGSAPRLHGR